MNATAASLLIALCALGTGITAAQAAPAPQPGDPAGQVSPSSNPLSGVVEEVVSMSEGAYRSTAYVVTWNGMRVLVDDPLDVHGSAPGDSLNYIATRVPTPDGRHLLAFTSLETKAARPSTGAAPPGSGSTTTASGVVEEVLQAQDGDYRFIAYIVRLGDARVAVWDTLAESHFAIGDTIPVLELRVASRAGTFLHFQINAERLPRSTATQAPPPATAMLDSGSVEQVLAAASQGYTSRAYVVRWRDADVLVEDATAASDYQAGDSLQFRILRSSPLPGAHGAGTLTLLLETPPASPADESVPLHSSSVTQSAQVERVLSWQDGADRAVAYLVHWNGVPVAVTDEFASTSYVPGERIEFSVVRGTDALGKHLEFLMFAFPVRH